MKRIKLTFVLLLIALTVFWILADPILFSRFDVTSLQVSLVHFSGIIAMGTISAAMILVIRSTRINGFLGGLDKSYRLHKWLGIAGLITATLHWASVNFPKWLLGWEAMELPSAQTNPILSFFRDQYTLAGEIGDLFFKVFVILVVLALVKWFPYRYFFKTHRLLAIVFLLLVFHSVVLMKFEYWGEIIAPLMVVLMTGGALAALVSLFRRIGHRRRVVGVIDEIVSLDQSGVLRVVIAFKDKWPGHKEGQFAFVTFDRKEGAHPFTISSPWIDNGKIFFLIKGLGDYTRDLQDKLNVGDYAEVEGPYGEFNFQSGKQHQIWVAGGIGIAPFMAGLKALARKEDKQEKQIDLFYSSNEIEETLVGKLREGAGAAKIRLHIIQPDTDGRLDFERIRELVPEWRLADIWFCGPAGFGAELMNDAVASGISADDFHQELFEMR